MNILDFIKSEENCINLVHEFFNGKYSLEDVKRYLYNNIQFKDEDRGAREGVFKLAEEWNEKQLKGDKEISEWYATTDFYIFDLLPWNACDMFVNKFNELVPHIDKLGGNKIIDYGAGLGITTLLLKEKFPDREIVYCDFVESKQCQFFKFIQQKFNIGSDIRIVDVDEFIKSDEKFDCVFAMDCFEHIPNIDKLILELGKHTNLIIHDSTFESNEAQPQHLYTGGILWFTQLMLDLGYHPIKDIRVLSKYRFFINKGNVEFLLLCTLSNSHPCFQ